MTDEEFVQAELWKVANVSRRDVANEIAAAILAAAPSYSDSRQRDVVYDMERVAREIGKDAAQPGICRRCFHTAHEDVGECRACYCRSAAPQPSPGETA